KVNKKNYKLNSFKKQIYTDIKNVRNLNKKGNTNTYIYLNKSEEGSSFTLNENRKDIKKVYLPKTCKIDYTRPMIKFKADGTPYPSGTTIRIIYKDTKKEITIVPISGRVLIKEDKYEM